MAPTTTTTNGTQRTLDDEQLDQIWMDAVNTVTAKAYETMPEAFETVKTAYNLVFEGKVQRCGPHAYMVATDFKTGREFWQVQEDCDCPDGKKLGPEACPHRLAVRIYLRAKALLSTHSGIPPSEEGGQHASGVEAPQQSHADNAGTPSSPPPPSHEDTTEELKPRVKVPERYMANIHGVRAIKFVGLLMLAHKDGLTSLKADFTDNREELAIAHAVAIFNDGRHFEDSGDSTPANVGHFVRDHFRRVALTRAKARALKDALGLDLVSDVELAE